MRNKSNMFVRYELFRNYCIAPSKICVRDRGVYKFYEKVCNNNLLLNFVNAFKYILTEENVNDVTF